MKTKLKLTGGNSVLLNIAAIIIFFLSWTAIFAQDYTKTYQENYDVDKGANLVIQNKFGAINCQTWDQSSISINVTVKVEASSQEKANKVFDKINVKLSGTRTDVQGITTVSNVNNAEFSINYEIRMPRWVNLDLNNQFGEIFLDETDGMTRIKLEYGSMEAIAFNGPKTELEIKFSDVEAGFIKDGNLNIEYSEWESKGAENLRVYSRFGEITIGKVAKLNLDSQYDDVNIGSVNEIISVSRFSDVEIDKINGDFDIDIEYGEFKAEYISPAFKVGKIRNTFAGASLAFDPGSGMNINARLEFGELSYPKALSMNHSTEGYATNIYKGRLGTTAGVTSELTVNSKNADVKIVYSE